MLAATETSALLRREHNRALSPFRDDGDDSPARRRSRSAGWACSCDCEPLQKRHELQIPRRLTPSRDDIARLIEVGTAEAVPFQNVARRIGRLNASSTQVINAD